VGPEQEVKSGFCRPGNASRPIFEHSQTRALRVPGPEEQANKPSSGGFVVRQQAMTLRREAAKSRVHLRGENAPPWDRLSVV
jgi:hypothetical protein